MVTDRNGKEIKVGDTVLVRAKVSAISEADLTPNVSCITFPSDTEQPISYGLPHLHGSHVEVVVPEDQAASA